MAVFVPVVAAGSATKVITPVVVFKVKVPSPAIDTMPSGSHAAGDDAGVMRHEEEATSPTPDVASAPVPVMVVNVAVPPGITALDSGVATGAGGSATVGVIVALAIWPVVSATTYFTDEATPVKDANGLNVTVPFALTVYVPSFGTVNVVKSQLAFAVEVVAHNFTDEATRFAPDPAASFVSGEIVWFVS
jgi:hypothetical protein